MTDLIFREWGNTTIRQREDGYLSLTDMAQACGKRVSNWERLDSTKEYLEALYKRRYSDLSNGNLVEIIQGGTPENQGTWGHRKVAIRFAQWLNPYFAIQVDDWVEELLTKGIVINESSFTDEEVAQIIEIVEARDRRIQQLENVNEKLTERNKVLSYKHLHHQAMERFFITRIEYRKGAFIDPQTFIRKYQEFWETLGQEYEGMPAPIESEIRIELDRYIADLKERMKRSDRGKKRESNVFFSPGQYLEGCKFTQFVYPEDTFYGTIGTFIDN